MKDYTIADFLNKDFCMLEAACGTGRFSCVIAKYVKELIIAVLQALLF